MDMNYYHVWVTLCSYDKEIKVVKDFAYYCTEERIHEIVWDILSKLDAAGMTFRETNEARYFTVEFSEVPSPMELEAMFN